MLWGAAIIGSLGLALPWAEAALERYKMRNTYYGELEGSFVGRGSDLFKRGWWIWLAALLAIPLLVAAAPRGPKPNPAQGGVFFFAMLAVVIAAVFLYGAYKVVLWRWWLEGLRIGDIRATSDLRTWAYIGNSWKFIGCTALTFLVVGVSLLSYLMMRFAGVPFDQAHGAQSPAILVLVGGAYLVSLLALGALYRIYFIQRVWKLVVRSLTLHGLEAARDVRAREGTADALGEGLIDSLDVVGF